MIRRKKIVLKKANSRARRKLRIQKKINGSTDRPRLSVFRSLNHIYASIIDDSTGKVLVAASSLKLQDKGSGKEIAKNVGLELGKRAVTANIKKVVFDRNGYIYHGRVLELANGARESGLVF
jgi:large subunit ribosomal protein L18